MTKDKYLTFVYVSQYQHHYFSSDHDTVVKQYPLCTEDFSLEFSLPHKISFN